MSRMSFFVYIKIFLPYRLLAPVSNFIIVIRRNCDFSRNSPDLAPLPNRIQLEIFEILLQSFAIMRISNQKKGIRSDKVYKGGTIFPIDKYTEARIPAPFTPSLCEPDQTRGGISLLSGYTLTFSPWVAPGLSLDGRGETGLRRAACKVKNRKLSRGNWPVVRSWPLLPSGISIRSTPGFAWIYVLEEGREERFGTQVWIERQ